MGNEFVIAVPFKGNAEFFKVQPNRFGSTAANFLAKRRLSTSQLVPSKRGD
jgi:hypothetical protein